MTYLPEPTTAAEVIERARAVARRHAMDAMASRMPHAVQSRSADPEKFEAIRKAAQARSSDQAISAQMSQAHRFLGSIRSPASASQIIQEVALEYRVSVNEILGERRSAKILTARWEAIRRVYDATEWSLSRISRIFNRDHSTIINALRKMGVRL